MPILLIAHVLKREPAPVAVWLVIIQIGHQVSLPYGFPFFTKNHGSRQRLEVAPIGGDGGALTS